MLMLLNRSDGCACHQIFGLFDTPLPHVTKFTIVTLLLCHYFTHNSPCSLQPPYPYPTCPLIKDNLRLLISNFGKTTKLDITYNPKLQIFFRKYPCSKYNQNTATISLYAIGESISYLKHLLEKVVGSRAASTKVQQQGSSTCKEYK